jgi:hypothetical protein
MVTRDEILLNDEQIGVLNLKDVLEKSKVDISHQYLNYDGYFRDEGFVIPKTSTYIRIEYPNGNSQLEYTINVDIPYLLNKLDKYEYLLIGKQRDKVSLRKLKLTSSEWRHNLVIKLTDIVNQYEDFKILKSKIDDHLSGIQDTFIVKKFYTDLKYMEKVFDDFAWSDREKIGFLRMFLTGYLQGVDAASLYPPNEY